MTKLDEMREKIIETINSLTENQLRKINDMLRNNILQLRDIDELYDAAVRKQNEARQKPSE